MKTKLVILLLVGLNAACLVSLAQNNPATDNKVQKLYNQPETGVAAAAAPADTAPEVTGEVLPLVQFEDAPLVDVIKTLARQANLNVVFDPRVTALGPDGKSLHPAVSIRLENVTAQNVLEAVLNNNNLRLERDPKTKISRVTIKDPAAAEPLATKVYQLKYSYPTNLVLVVKPTLGARSQVIPDARTSQLIVLATEKELLEIDALIDKLDTPTKQVLIEARILETSKNPITAKGINWAGTVREQNFAFGNQQGFGDLLHVDTQNGLVPAIGFLNADGVRGVLSWFNEDNAAEVIATPRTVTADNTTATLSVTRAIPIYTVSTGGTQSGPTVSVTYTNLGTLLTVTPRISANNKIALKVIPEVSNVESVDSQTINSEEFTANIYLIRRAETQVLIPSGNTLVMGGLIKDDLTKAQTKVPVLGDLPGIGYAFRSHRKERKKSNLMIFVTPTIVSDEDFTPTETEFLKKKPPVDRPENQDPEFDGWLDTTKAHDWSQPVY
jgi:type II secretory pathway component GspD/PulD (secretin)